MTVKLCNFISEKAQECCSWQSEAWFVGQTSTLHPCSFCFVLFCSALFCIRRICSGCKHPQEGWSILSVCIMLIYSWCWQTRRAGGEGNEWCQSCHWVCQRPTLLINEKAVRCYCCNAAAYMIHKCFSLLYLVIVEDASQAGRQI